MSVIFMGLSVSLTFSQQYALIHSSLLRFGGLNGWNNFNLTEDINLLART